MRPGGSSQANNNCLAPTGQNIQLNRMMCASMAQDAYRKPLNEELQVRVATKCATSPVASCKGSPDRNLESIDATKEICPHYYLLPQQLSLRGFMCSLVLQYHYNNYSFAHTQLTHKTSAAEVFKRRGHSMTSAEMRD
eukprot:5795572-Amphidinium_carterae.1